MAPGSAEPVMFLHSLNLYLPFCYLLIILSVLGSFLFFGLPQPPNSGLDGSLSPTKCSTLCNCPRITAPSGKEKQIQQINRGAPDLEEVLGLVVSYSPDVQ